MNLSNIAVLGRPSKDSQSISMEERILLAARKEFVKKGFKAVSMDDIAKSANTTKATIYSYFKSKTILFTRTVVHLMKMIKESTDRILKQDDIPFKERLINLTVRFADATQSVDVNNFIILALPSLTVRQQEVIENSKKYMHSAIEDAFKREMELGSIPLKDTNFLLQTFIAIMNIVKYTVYDDQISDNVEERASEVVNFFWKGLFFDDINKEYIDI